MTLYGPQQDHESQAAMPPVFFSALAAQLIEALSSATASPIESIERDLSQMISRILKKAHPEAIAVIQGRLLEGPVVDAYSLGQIGFAHQMAANAASSRVDELFLNALKTTKFAVYLEELYKGERTNKELGQISGQTDEHVSRLLKELRQEGITDFRKDGKRVINFLTPVARQLLESRKEQADEIHRMYVDPIAPQVQATLEQVKAKLPPYMRNAPTFDLAST